MQQQQQRKHLQLQSTPAWDQQVSFGGLQQEPQGGSLANGAPIGVEQAQTLQGTHIEQYGQHSIFAVCIAAQGDLVGMAGAIPATLLSH